MSETDPVFSKIAEDERGASWSILLPDGQELVLIRTNAGYWRGGHSHNVDEVSVLLSGKALYLKRSLAQEELTFIEGPGDVLPNLAGEEHAAFALEDYWLIDIRPGSKASDIHNTDYPLWREFVNRQVKR